MLLTHIKIDATFSTTFTFLLLYVRDKLLQSLQQQVAR